MVVTPLPIVTLVSLLQSLNAEEPMLVTESGIVTLVRAHSKNAELPMFVTLLGITTLVRLQSRNAELMMLVTPSGITTVEGHAPFIPYATSPNTTSPSGWLL